MFEELMNNISNERNKLLDKCTKELIELTGLKVPENASNFEIVVLLNDLKINGYKIAHYYKGNDFLVLVKINDLHENIEAEYQIKTEVEDNRVSIVAIRSK